MDTTNLDNTRVSCEDIGIILKDMRAIDDRIIYQVNLATPTASFRSEINPTDTCKVLYGQLEKTYEDRNKLINSCLNEFRVNILRLKEKYDSNKDDIKARRSLRDEERKVRDLQSELTIEDIIRQRSAKAFSEKCKLFFKPTK